MLKRFYTAIVHRRRAVLAAFVLAAVLSVFASRAVQVDYDINDYLPPESPSTTAIEVMCGTSRCPRHWTTKKNLPPSTAWRP